MKQSLKYWLQGLTVTLAMLSCWTGFMGTAAAAPAGQKTWIISGRALSLRGEPLAGAIVRLETEGSVKGEQKMETNLQGEFQTEIGVDPSRVTRLRGALVATKTGYAEGREPLDLYLDSSASGIDIILCKPDEGKDQFPIDRLVSILAPQLKSSAAKEFAGQTEFVRGYEELVDRQDTAAAIPLFEKSAERAPECIECQLLLELAFLRAGRWGSAIKHLEDTSLIVDLFGTRRPELDLIKGIVEAWRGHSDEAISHYMSVLEGDPNNALALQESGRIALAQRNWEAADRYLSKALLASAGEDVRLLRVGALLELGKVNEASDEMDQYVAKRDIKDLPQSARAFYYEVQNRFSMLSKGSVTSMTTQPLEELLMAVPDLQGLEPAADQSLLEELLNRVGQEVDAFFHGIPNTASLEKVRQERLNRDGKVATFLDQEFQYIMLAQSGEPGMGIREYRSTEDGRDAALAGLKQGLMLTSGFASISSIFHPVNRRGADFRYLGKQKTDGREAHVIAFSQEPGTAKMVTRFVTDNRSALALVHGLAWVDTRTFQILRLNTSLLRPLPTVQLLKLSTDILFQEVAFEGVSAPLWLPKEVDIMVNYRGRILHNKHSYSDFRLFNVESREDGKPVHVPPPPPASDPPKSQESDG